MRLFPLLLLAAAPMPGSAAAAPPQAAPAESRPAVITPVVVARYPHDPQAFTEGLLWHRGHLYESVGLEGQSDVRRVDLASGRVLARATIPAGMFGEGLAVWKNALISLTWHGGVAYRWNAATLARIGTARYRGEGWGLTTLGDALVRSDGSATLTVHDPATMAVRRRIAVTINGKPIDQLNELEAVDGAILANVWRTPYLVRIDPASGRVTAVVDLRAIVAEVGLSNDIEAVANGIAWDAQGRRLFITGKRWPTLFEIRLPG
ncbi:glutaminyl-peptide cyclotransferase [Sphingomonas sp. MMSM20]|uniref:glutaminyl-peptide cyclotransferase n=1 Tax=Sphingomonas lycopersici TaxID=2951807 RepID=UPI002236FFC2|nr:glutaminyl-peptide cyclotransferase [Sphingomonas lycopersici]MCW6531553.1 glutaminyl-peptide cyclotransferase [Sphingomonas lycopersici]